MSETNGVMDLLLKKIYNEGNRCQNQKCFQQNHQYESLTTQLETRSNARVFALQTNLRL